MEMTSAFTLNVRLDNIAVITIDVPGEKRESGSYDTERKVEEKIKRPCQQLTGAYVPERN